MWSDFYYTVYNLLAFICQQIFSPNNEDVYTIYNNIQLDDDREKIRKEMDWKYVTKGKEHKNDWYQFDDESFLFCYEDNKLIMKAIINHSYGVIDGSLQSKFQYTEKLLPERINEIDYDMDLTDVWKIFGFNFIIAGDFETIMVCLSITRWRICMLSF